MKDGTAQIQIGGGMSFTNQRNILMECLDSNSKTYVIIDTKTDLEYLKKMDIKDNKIEDVFKKHQV